MSSTCSPLRSAASGQFRYDQSGLIQAFALWSVATGYRQRQVPFVLHRSKRQASDAVHPLPDARSDPHPGHRHRNTHTCLPARAFRRPTDKQAFSSRAREVLPDLHRFQLLPGAQEPTGYLSVNASDQLDAQMTPATAGGELGSRVGRNRPRLHQHHECARPVFERSPGQRRPRAWRFGVSGQIAILRVL